MRVHQLTFQFVQTGLVVSCCVPQSRHIVPGGGQFIPGGGQFILCHGQLSLSSN
jgi:hypothetical protein